MSLTQYLESQEDQNMTRLLNFTRTQEKRKERGVFVSFGMKEKENHEPRPYFNLWGNLVH